MCGRYYIDKGTIQSLGEFPDFNEKQLFGKDEDVHPSEAALVLRAGNSILTADQMIWGFPRFDGKGLVINARAESAMEKRMFRENILYRRCVIVAKGFYEWTKTKEKYSFERENEDTMFLAGCFQSFQGQNRFVILTTSANNSVEPIHDRMPLILEKEEVENWIWDKRAAEHILRKRPAELKKETEYEQLKLFL